VLALKGRLTKAEHDALPEPLKEHYAEKDGSFVLQAEGLPDPAAFNEFRENNRRMKIELETLRERYKDVDPEEFRRLRTELDALKKKPPGDDVKEAELKWEKRLHTLETKLQTAEAEKTALAEKADQQAFDTSVKDVAAKAGVQADYLEDVLARARRTGFRLVEGTVKALKGDEPLRDEETGKPVTLDGFVKALPGAFFGRTSGTRPDPNTRSGGGGLNGQVKVLMDPTPLEMGRQADKIAKGEVEVRRTV
jgi:hypothetical protein